MVQYYAGRVRRGKMALEEVPARWREAVEAMLGEEGA